MALNVKFLQGLQSAYDNLVTKDANTFYLTESNLYIGNMKLTSAADVAAALARIETNETNISTIQTNIGKVEELATTNKTLVPALNELRAAIGAGGTASALTITGDAATGYVFTQGETEIGIISIPKDMVVSTGSVEVNPDGQEAGTYLVLTLANATNDKVYINVGTLVDIYTAAQGATQVQLSINNLTREISAVIVAESITADELAANAVTTVKIADGNVTKAKLSEEVLASLVKADTAVQVIESGSTNGTIKVDGADVAVTGLGSAAFTNKEAYDEAGAAAAVNTALSERIEALEDEMGEGGSVETQITNAINNLDVADTAVATEYVSAVSQVDGKVVIERTALPDYTNTYDAKGAAEAAQTAANSYTDEQLTEALTWGSF